MSAVAVVVVNHDGAEHLPGCLRSFRQQTHAPAELVVVDNASRDGSRQLLERRRREDRLRIVANTVNRGYAGGANDGIAVTDSPVVAVANFDVRPEPDYLAAVSEVLDARPRCGAVQGKLLRLEPGPGGDDLIDTTGHLAHRTRLFSNRGEGEVDRGQFDRPGRVFGVSGALAVYRRAMLAELALPTRGGRREVFDEDLFAFFEDVDLDWRAALMGWQVRYQPAAVARHQRGGAGPRRSAFVERLNWRNRLLCVLKNDDLGALSAQLPGFAGTTLLKSLELGVTAPAALLGGVADLRLGWRMHRKRRIIGGRAVVSRRAVVERWFEPFDYAAWVRRWWRRVREDSPGR